MSDPESQTNAMIEQLVNMGFSQERAEKAVFVTGSSVESAAGWLIDNGDDVDNMDVPQAQHKQEAPVNPHSAPSFAADRQPATIRPESESFVFVNDELKLVLLVRRDLAMSPGKVAAQCSHATLGAYRLISETDPVLMSSWELAGEAIIVLGVDNEEQLRDFEEKARSAGLCTHFVTDAGRTEVAPSTATVASLGPALVSRIDSITGHLRLF